MQTSNLTLADSTLIRRNVIEILTTYISLQPVFNFRLTELLTYFHVFEALKFEFYIILQAELTVTLTYWTCFCLKLHSWNLYDVYSFESGIFYLHLMPLWYASMVLSERYRAIMDLLYNIFPYFVTLKKDLRILLLALLHIVWIFKTHAHYSIFCKISFLNSHYNECIMFLHLLQKMLALFQFFINKGGSAPDDFCKFHFIL